MCKIGFYILLCTFVFLGWVFGFVWVCYIDVYGCVVGLCGTFWDMYVCDWYMVRFIFKCLWVVYYVVYVELCVVCIFVFNWVVCIVFIVFVCFLEGVSVIVGGTCFCVMVCYCWFWFSFRRRFVEALGVRIVFRREVYSWEVRLGIDMFLFV